MPAGEGLVLEGVAAGYGRHRVLVDVSLTVRPGEVVGVIGANGSGKTTIVRVASRGLPPWAGSVAVEGRDPYRLRPREAARLVAVVPQELAPAFPFSVLDVVLMGRSPYLSPWGGGGPDDWAQARRAMVQANVQHLADRPLAELSGGELRRVVLAQALAQDAPVLLLDEPTTHLDVKHVVQILSLVRGIARNAGNTVLAVFHDLSLAAAHCDRLYALAGGRVVASGSPREVVSRDLIRTVYGLEADVVPAPATGLPVVVPSAPAPGPPPGHARAHVVGGAGRGAAAIRLLSERGFEVTAGVLHATDTDEEVAERLNLLRVTVAPFSPVDAAAVQECRRLVDAAAVLVVSDPPFGPGNLENLRMAVEAAHRGVRTIVLERQPVEERDFTGGEATALWRALCSRAVVVGSDEELGRVAGETAPRVGRASSRGGRSVGV